ncbi:MAG TPA: hypothetical protein VND91_04925 [Candidatus Saccharimonadia bacterium]|nr:hypothetical protein [Candidatus Saccharimonadia bacterium]
MASSLDTEGSIMSWAASTLHRTRRALRGLATIALLLAAHAATAQRLPFDLPAPYDGAYFDPTQRGIGLWLDSGPDGTTFGALMYYAPDGRPTFATFADTLGFTGSLAESFTGVRGLQGPLFESIDGQCPGCPPRAPRSAPMPGDFRADLGHRTGRVTFAGSRFQMQAVPIGRAEPELFDGTWWLSLDDFVYRPPVGNGDSGTFAERNEIQAVVRLGRADGLRFVPPPVPGDYGFPTADAIVYQAQCVASCGDFESWRLAAGAGARVLAFARPHTSQFESAAFGRWVETEAGLVRAPDTSTHSIKTDPWAMHSIATTLGAPRVAFYRSPIVAPCDGDVLCRSTQASADDPSSSFASEGDRFAEITRGLSGAYYDPAQPGTGLWIDAGRNGETFMTLMTYAARGDGGADPVFYSLGGPIRLQPVAILGGIPGVISPLYQSRAGQQLGGAWRAPTTRIATELGNARLLFFSQSAVTLEVAGATYRMVPLRPDRATADVPRGRWLLTLRDQLEFGPGAPQPVGEPFAQVESLTAQVEVSPEPIAPAFPVDGTTTLRPQSGARTYAIRCTESCGDFDHWRSGHEVGLWVDPDGRAVLSQTARLLAIGSVVPATARQYALTLHDDTIDGFGRTLATPSGGRTLNRGVLRMHRNPPQSFCDSDTYCE